MENKSKWLIQWDNLFAIFPEKASLTPMPALSPTNPENQ